MRNKGVIFGILLFLAVITIGYALLSGNINVSSTANINPTDISLELEYGVVPYGDNSFSTSTTETGHSNESISCSGMRCSYSVAFNNSGAIQAFYVQVTNNSSFDVKIKQVNINSEYTGSIKNGSSAVFGVYRRSKAELVQSSDRLGVMIINPDLPSTDNMEISGDEFCNKPSCYMSKNGGVYTIGIAEMATGNEKTNKLDYGVTRTFDIVFEQVS